MQEDETLMTVKEAAAFLKVSDDSIRRWLKTGRLQGKRLGGVTVGWRISVGAIRAFLATDETKTA